MRRLAVTFTVFAAALLVAAPLALAEDHGEGTYGVASDKVVTNAGFMVIAFFPLLILVLSLIQWQLEKRKDRRKKLTKKLDADWSGGW
ncbi:MAG: hypothetical protein R2736_20680 [Solirubrobacterales bacterium]